MAAEVDSEQTMKALQSALQAARRERAAITDRLAEVDELIDRLAQVAGNGATSPQAARGGPRPRSAASRRRVSEQGAGRTGGRAYRRRQHGSGRTDRIVELVAGAEHPLTTGEVRARLRRHEPDVTSQLVSASLAYAERKGRVRRTDDRRWIAGSGV